jgi:hypothetical protein
MYLEWPYQIWAASLDLNFLKDFLKLFVNMHLAISFAESQEYEFHNFWTYRSKVMDV